MPKPTQNTPPIAGLLYTIIFIGLLPLSIIGYLLWVGALLLKRNEKGSSTAQSPLFARWLQHQLGTRPDEPAARLLWALPGIPRLGVKLVATPILMAHHLSGYVPATFRYPFHGDITLQNQSAARQTLYDEVVSRYLPKRPQLVILGAGFDTRAFRLPDTWGGHAFEVDTPSTIAVKREALAKAGIIRNDVSLVAADFEQEKWYTKLLEAGFDPQCPALFLCEGVLPYLEQAAVFDTFRTIAATAPQSIIAFDYFTSEVLTSNASVMRVIRASLRAGGETLKFGVESTPSARVNVAQRLETCGLTLIEHRTAGQERDKQRAWGGFAIAIVP